MVPGITETYTYDAFGNMRSSSVGAPAAIDPITNHVTSPPAAYDEGGNLTNYMGTYLYSYDPFGLIREKDYQSLQDSYIYDADDERIAVVPVDGCCGVWHWSLRDLSGNVIRQYESYGANSWTWIEDYVYRDGLLLAGDRVPEEGGRRQFHLDHLGTPRLITGSNAQQISVHDYLPFGNETTFIGQETGIHDPRDREDPMKFTGHERDFNIGTQTQNTNYDDYMHARFYDPSAG